MKRETLEALTEYGFSIFPCVPGGKRPLTAHGFKDATDNIDAAWLMFIKNNEANVGISMGKISKCWVLDVDVKDGKIGDKSLAALIEEYGTLPETVKARTWSGGEHYFFCYPHDQDVKTRAGFVPDLDVRSDGSYVVAPPSTCEGKPYEWINSPEETMMADAPQWLIELINKNGNGHVDLSNSTDKIEGNRNDTLHKIASTFKRNAVEDNMILTLVQGINQARCKPPLPDSEVRKLVGSALKYEVKPQATEPWTDIWNGKRFKELHGTDTSFCDDMGGWHLWEVMRWLKDKDFGVMRLAHNVIETLRMEARNKNDKDLLKWAIKSSTDAKLKAMLSQAKTLNLARDADAFDSNSYVINCMNGTLDLRSGELRDHDKADYITKLAPVRYNPDAECPRWLQFLDEIFLSDAEYIAWMQRAIGYSLSGDVSEQCFFILWGNGCNGKSTLLKHIFKIMGDYAMGTKAATLMERRDNDQTNDIAVLKGARFISAAETGQHKYMSEALIKQLTGDDPITARMLYHENFTYFATFKIFLATNHKPPMRGTDDGIKRRLKLLPFLYKVPAEKLKEDLDTKLYAEAEGIFAWAVEGFKQWHKQGLGECAAVDDFSKEFFHDRDIIGQFIEEEMDIYSTHQAPITQTLEEINNWIQKEKISKRIISRNDITEYLEGRGFKKVRFTSGPCMGKTGFEGIGLKSMQDTSFRYGANQR